MVIYNNAKKHGKPLFGHLSKMGCLLYFRRKRKMNFINPNVEAQKLLQAIEYTGGAVDLQQVTNHLEIEVCEVSLVIDHPNIQGWLRVLNDKIQLGVEKYESEENKRIIIAHLIGNYLQGVMETEEMHLKCRGKIKIGWESIEVNANDFALALLIPENDVLKEATTNLFLSPEWIANIYKTSRTAAKKRLDTLNLRYIGE